METAAQQWNLDGKARDDCREFRVVLIKPSRYDETGYVVALKEKPDKKFAIKPIEDLPDAFPVITNELLSLTRWIADYYRASWGEAIKAALPSGADDESRDIITVTEKGLSALKSDSLPANARRILEIIQSKRKSTAKQIQRLLGKHFSAHALSLEAPHQILIGWCG